MLGTSALGSAHLYQKYAQTDCGSTSTLQLCCAPVVRKVARASGLGIGGRDTPGVAGAYRQ